MTLFNDEVEIEKIIQWSSTFYFRKILQWGEGYILAWKGRFWWNLHLPSDIPAQNSQEKKTNTPDRKRFWEISDCYGSKKYWGSWTNNNQWWHRGIQYHQWEVFPAGAYLFPVHLSIQHNQNQCTQQIFHKCHDHRKGGGLNSSDIGE